MSDNTRHSTIDRISIAFPELNTNWLLTGEGEMTKPIQQVGDISNSNVSGVNVNGTEIHINPDAYNTLLEIVKSNQKVTERFQKQTEKFQEQLDRLISIIENNEQYSRRADKAAKARDLLDRIAAISQGEDAGGYPPEIPDL